MTATTATFDATATRDRIAAAIDRVVAVPAGVLEPILCGVFARGHLLLEGIPGIGKTLLARTLAKCIGGEFRRIQFTNDLMPSDIVGTTVWKAGVEKFVFVRGPLFANVVLADEINRTSPRTLSCLLEAMEAGRVSIEGRAVDLAQPFLVLATRNPIEFHGTFPVPEAALDRFIARVEIGYPQPERELQLYRGDDAEHLLAAVTPAISIEQLQAAQAQVDRVAVSEPVARYCHAVVAASRVHPEVLLGASPRAALAWLRAAKARAWLHGRDYVLPDDLKALCRSVLGHRVFMQGGVSAATLVAQLVEQTAVPV